VKLITAQLVKDFKNYPFGSQDKVKDPLVVAKFFDPCGSATWYLLEYDHEHRHAFCYVTGLMEDELGYVSLEELESIKRPFGLTIERDLYFTQEPLSHFK